MKKFIIIGIILFIISLGAIAYLNKVILPQKIKSLIISTLKKQTGKDVTIKSLEFSLFKGLVLRDLVVTDNQNVILSTRQADCSIFIWPIFKKQIIIPSIALRSPYIFLERRQDQSFNLQDLFTPAIPAKPADFSITVFKVSVVNGNVVFQDDTLAVKFKKELKNIQFSLHLGLPVNIKFNFKGEISNNPSVFIDATGEYKILNRELVSKVTVKNLSMGEFAVYYNNLSGSVSGLVNLDAQINFKGQMLQAYVNAKADSLVLAKDKLKAKINLNIQTKINYDLGSKVFSFDGLCDILQADISGIDFVDGIKNLRGKFTFNQDSLVAENLKAELLGKQFEIKLGVKDFNTPVLSIDTDLDLNYLPSILKDRFKFTMIDSASGKSTLSIKAYPGKNGDWALRGDMNIKAASLKLEKQNVPVENISLKLAFSQDGLNWENAKFKYQGIDFESSGTLVNFVSPGIKLKLYSADLSLVSEFDCSGKKLKLSQLKGKYLDSQFLISGDIDNTNPEKLQVDLNGQVNLVLGDLNRILAKQYPAIKTMKLAGQVDIKFNLNGAPVDFKNCYLRAKLTSNNFSGYGLHAQNLNFDFFQDQKIVKISAFRIGFYDGLIEGSAELNLDDLNPAYQLELKAVGIKIEKLKLDTPSKDKNISGTLLGELKLNGFLNDLNKLNGGGSFSISEGKLWELNLLQGIGNILFTKDLGSITFSDCSSDFKIKDKFVYMDNLKLKSEIANISGSLKIGFDSSLDGALNVEIISAMIPVTGTFKDVSTAILGNGGVFGVIKLGGTLSQPKHSFKPAVSNIIRGLTDVIFGK
ncbi:MAG: AsmA-like C-terminal region-containing protein [Candidatus Omnitrophota bacterium]